MCAIKSQIMKPNFKKLVMSNSGRVSKTATGTLQKRIQNIHAIWNNHHHDDVGIEKIFRLFLATSQFLFPGIYIKHFFGKKGSEIQDLGVDFYVLVKVILPISLVYAHWLPQNIALPIVIALMIETLLYVPTLIFATDHFARPSSYRRSMLLLFFNYCEIIFAFAYIYDSGNYLNHPFTDWFDPIYFSFTTQATIGFGDYLPINGMGKFLVCMQSLIFLAFVVLFINFFSNKLEHKGYFDHEKKA